MLFRQDFGPAFFMPSHYFIYILQTRSGAYYTGITTDLKRRLDEHVNSPRGSKYMRSHRPDAIAAAWKLEPAGVSENTNMRSLASRLESKIKALSRQEKESLIKKPSAIKGFDSFDGARCHSIHAATRKRIAREVLAKPTI
ncbi:MAG: GIY-YIG nuclease family protein [Leptospiraceae bacterium]|nr:GIY-YIG nuclease family protein [Leptospiraceae bacterium]MCB1303497.1 GIY-YIG nuclease family protein [Leptospiraceae bacterium]